ncbi:cryptochrome/photolyase family protein [Actinoallomurus soli]|uniref:cryptochrome/photolyase family protein n=1 Tax=Actinoallomurus soli TaxID=2952535 RepID=UPI002092A442|nr:deoxyribodipyrimidine photo-lyase [Actinoallomurus soli]MCO5973826.1 DNA photolyase family protein [Actinoallomurus soli]
MSVAICLFTGDLRVHDNPVLRAALRAADQVVPLFVVDDGVREAGFAVPNRAAFLADCLADLDGALRGRGGRLVVRRGDVVDEVARIAEETGAGEVHLARDVSAFAQRREARLRRMLEDSRRRLCVHDSVTFVVPPGALTPGSRGHFAVFTPYYRKWGDVPVREPLAAPGTVPVPAVRSERLPSGAELADGDPSPVLPRGGEDEGRRRAAAWLGGPITRYADRHDDLAGDATSRLSPYLHFGCLSAVELTRLATAVGGPGAEAFVRQLAWRDFNRQLLADRPEAAREDYRPRNDRWRADEALVAAWREGRTGYPLVDAAMRQMAREGWMHNRGRLVTASFLTKILYVDWRVGARHFLDLLVDGDIANNQLNWQWVAGTGASTRPNQVIDPLVQARRFDGRGDYVRRWVPELAGVEGAAVHRPWLLPAEVRRRLDYPDPVIGLDEGRERFHRARAGRSEPQTLFEL